MRTIEHVYLLVVEGYFKDHFLFRSTAQTKDCLFYNQSLDYTERTVLLNDALPAPGLPELLFDVNDLYGLVLSFFSLYSIHFVTLVSHLITINASVLDVCVLC